MMLVGPIIFVFIPRALSYRPKLITRVQDSNRRKYPFDLSHQISQIIKIELCFGPRWTQKLTFGPYNFHNGKNIRY